MIQFTNRQLLAMFVNIISRNLEEVMGAQERTKFSKHCASLENKPELLFKAYRLANFDVPRTGYIFANTLGVNERFIPYILKDLETCKQMLDN